MKSSLKIIQPGGQATRLLDKQGNVLFDQPDDGTGGRPEIPRKELRRILLESLPAGTVRWGHKVTAESPLGGACTTTHDALGRMTSEQEPFGQTLTFTYDADNNQIVVQNWLAVQQRASATR